MLCYSKEILDYFYNAEHTGRIIKPEAIGKAGSEQDGVVIELSWRVVDGRIEDSRFRTFGDVNAIAISSIVAGMLIGKSVKDAIKLSQEDIMEFLPDQNPKYKYMTGLVLIAIQNCYDNYLAKQKKLNNDISSLEENEAEEQPASTNLPEESVETNTITTEPSLDHNADTDEDYFDDDVPNNEPITIPADEGLSSVIDELLNNKSTVKQEQTQPAEEKRGRGRPRKYPEKQEVVGEKRGRGRPRKTPVEEVKAEIVGEKRGRGRPRKERTEEEILAIENKEKRGRGRPRKERSEEELLQLANKEKRGRGRPRKTPVEEVKTEIVGEKRGRGRPKKERTEEEILSLQNKEKRGRGRPRKADSYLTVVKPIVEEPVQEESKDVSKNEINVSNEKDENESVMSKYGVGFGLNTQNNVENTNRIHKELKPYNNTTFTIKYEKSTTTKTTNHTITSNFSNGNSVSQSSPKEEIEVENEEKKTESPLSKKMNDLMSSGTSIEEMLKVLMSDDENN